MTEDTSIQTPSTPAATKKAAARKTAAKKAAAAKATPEATAEAPLAPAKKAAAKKAAPAKKAAAKKATPGRTKAAVSAEVLEDAPAIDAPATDVSPESPSAGKRPARRRGAAPAAAAEADETPVAAAGSTRTRARRSGSAAANVDPLVVVPEALLAEMAPETSTRRRGRGSAAVPAFSAGAEPSAPSLAPGAGSDDEPSSPTRSRAPRASAAPFAVVFQPPAQDAVAESAPRSRRRGAAAPSAFEAPAPELSDEELTDEELAAQAASDEAAGEDDADDTSAEAVARRRRRRGRRGRGRARTDGPEGTDGGDDDPDREEAPAAADGDRTSSEGPDGPDGEGDDDSPSGTRRRRRRRSRSATGGDGSTDDPPNTVVRVRQPRNQTTNDDDEVRGIAGSTRMAAKQQRRREGREQGRRRPPILTEAEFLARREAVDRVMVIRQTAERTQIAVLEDGILVEHYVTRADAVSYVGNVYLGRVQNVLPSMEAAFIDISKGRNGVLYAGEVNYDASQFDGRPHRIESALKSGQPVLVQVTKDPIGHKGARLTSQVSLPGRYLVYVPEGSMTGISRKLPENERNRLKSILKKIVPEEAGVIVRTAAEGASEDELTRDIARLQAQWASIMDKAQKASGGPTLLYGEPDLVIRVVRDIFNEDFTKLVVAGRNEWELVEQYVETFAPELRDRVEQWTAPEDVFAAHRVDEQLIKALDRKVYLPSGGSLVIDRTEAMVVVDVNTGKFVGKGGNLEETVTKNNIEAAEEIVRQLRLRDLGGIIVIDFIDMVLESNRELVLRRLIECLGRDRTKHQVAEVTSLGLVQMTRKRVGQGLLEAFSETCEVCNGRGMIVSLDPNVPGAPGNGRGAKQEHRHEGASPRPEKPRGDSARGESGRGESGRSESGRGESGRGDGGRGQKRAGTDAAPADVVTDDVDGATATAEPTEGGRRRRGRRGSGGAGGANASATAGSDNGASNGANNGANNGAINGAVNDSDGSAAAHDGAARQAQLSLTETPREPVHEPVDAPVLRPRGGAVKAPKQTSIVIADEALDIEGDGAASSKRPARRRRKAVVSSDTN
ncbi:MAG: ribonuclease [Frankiaceae bacterium]|nr:ribonuclease [Frankiaceae bacterium]